MKTLLLCRFENCDRLARSGICLYCDRHYKQTIRNSQKMQGLCQHSRCPKPRTRESQYCGKHQKQMREYKARVETPEQRTVSAHLQRIRSEIPAYQGMSFCPAWNPACGGTIKAGEEWIIAHLGRRPSPRYDLH